MSLFVAVDNDQKGSDYSKVLHNSLAGITITRLLPQAKDWNDDLKAVG